MFDIVIAGGTVFDGSGAPGQRADVGIKDGKITAIEAGITSAATASIDATDCWVTPGFIDLHTHYDAEVEVAPALFESVRHGITTIFLGSCSLGAAIGEPEDIADIFCRVEGIPREIVLPVLQERKDWTTLTDYLAHLEKVPLGPNVASYVGHSNLRMVAMGFERSVNAKIRANADELAAMKRMLNEGLDAGYLGLSVQTLPWDKLDGDRERSKPLPSFFAPWSEYRALSSILRKRDRVFQGVPNLVTKMNVALFMLESIPLFRPALRTTIISLMDVIGDRNVVRWVPLLLRLVNGLLRGNFRMQALPNLFDVWADGMQLVIFEEFGAGGEAMHVADLAQRAELLRDPAYRQRFAKQWASFFVPRIYHRDLGKTEITGCPDASLVGRSFADVAKERGGAVTDVFLDLCADHGENLRWHTSVANDRREMLERIVASPDVLIGFSDAGAHLRNMAFYNYPLRLLKLVRDAELRGEAFMSIERAVHRLTGEVADWFRLDVGHLAIGKRADIVVVRPDALDARLDDTVEAEMSNMGGLIRLVRRNDAAVPAVLIGGKIASREGVASEELGQSHGFGTVLRC